MRHVLLILLLVPCVALAVSSTREPLQETPNVDVRVPVTVEIPISIPVDVTTPVDARTDVDVPVEVNNTNNTQIVNPDDIKIRNTPSIGLATPSDSIGFTFAIPGFATGVNLPWSFGDRKLLPVYDRLMAAGDEEAATLVMCMTSVMKKAFDTGAMCNTSLSTPLGGGVGEGKTEIVYETVVGPMLLADVDDKKLKELEEALARTRVELKNTQSEVSDLKSEVKRRTQDFYRVQQEIEETESARQQGLDDFLRSLEQREKK